jgi:E-phenylitaconyl-CoA hydratase
MAVRFEHADGIAVVTIDREAKLNAMDPQTYDEITDAFRKIDSLSDVRVGIVTGAGDRAFSSGADLTSMHQGSDSPSTWLPWQPDRWDFGVTPTKPMIAAINGYALAGGLELALACDIRLASETAVFGTPEVKWDLLHGYGAYRLPQIIGLSHAMQLLLTGAFIDAHEALRIGLVSRVVEADQLLTTARDLAGTIAANGPMALRMTKELVQRGLELPYENYARLMQMFYERIDGSEDQREGLNAFAERRQPSYPSKGAGAASDD